MPGARIAETLAVAAVTGVVVATAAMMLANRLLPANLAGHDLWQERVFWLAWLATLAHAAVRTAAVGAGDTSRAWAEQCWMLALLGAAVAIANWVTTGNHPGRTIAAGGYWPVAGGDLVLLAGASASAWAGHRLGTRGTLRRASVVAVAHGKPAHV